MHTIKEWTDMMNHGELDEKIDWLYCGDTSNKLRYTALLDRFSEIFGKDREAAIFSAPGRTEIGGNHTDHQHGRVLAGSVNLDVIAAVSFNDDMVIRVQSEGYPMDIVDLGELEPKPEETNRSQSLIRGVAARFSQMGCEMKGIDIYTVSNVLKGSGLSSSAAFEVLVGTVINELFFEGKASAVEIAQIGQYAENVFFGKPCGLMDQTASSVGNMVAIDFEDPSAPVVNRVDFDFAGSGYDLCIIDSGADHADLTDEYAAITGELRVIADYFGKKVLREIPENEFMAALPALRSLAGDRALLRAIHFYADNSRVPLQVQALRDGDFELFLRLINESGVSSWCLLQNVVPAGYVAHQDVAFTLALCGRLLGGRGACRVHGGGFAGTVQAFVPHDMLMKFKSGIEAVLGSDSCHVLSIRPAGGIQL